MERKRAEVFLALGFLFSWCCVTKVAAVDGKDAFLLRLLENENLELCFSNRLYTQEQLNPGAEFDQYRYDKPGQEKLRDFITKRKDEAIQKATEERKSLRAQCLGDKLSFCDREFRESDILLERCQILVKHAVSCAYADDESERLRCFRERLAQWEDSADEIIGSLKGRELKRESLAEPVRHRVNETSTSLGAGRGLAVLMMAEADLWIGALRQKLSKEGAKTGSSSRLRNASALKLEMQKFEGELADLMGRFQGEHERINQDADFAASRDKEIFRKYEEDAGTAVYQMCSSLNAIGSILDAVGLPYQPTSEEQRQLALDKLNRNRGERRPLSWELLPAHRNHGTTSEGSWGVDGPYDCEEVFGRVQYYPRQAPRRKNP